MINSGIPNPPIMACDSYLGCTLFDQSKNYYHYVWEVSIVSNWRNLKNYKIETYYFEEVCSGKKNQDSKFTKKTCVNPTDDYGIAK